MKRLGAIFLAALSGVCLTAAFPPFDVKFIALPALTPLMILCWFASPRQAFWLGALTGIVAWFPSIWWLAHVTWAGMIGVGLYCALYTAAFACAAALSLRLPRMRGRLWSFGPLLAWPAMWVAFEFLRGTLLTGFPWNPLGNALYRNLFVAQAAELGGVYLLSYLPALTSAGLAITAVRFFNDRRKASRVPHFELWLSVIILALVFHAGRYRFKQFQSRSANITIAAVQPNIPQSLKWNDSFGPIIYDRLETGMRMAMAKGKPDLIIWPETALPDYVLYNRGSFDFVTNFLAEATPLLVGSLHYTMKDEQACHYNSSFLFLPGQEGEPERYDKRHLVLFGEYVPFEKYCRLLRWFTPIEGNITPGERDTIFWLPGTRQFFAALICFEDVFPAIARRMVLSGARMLVNQTNDAWFDPSPASMQHMAHSVIRAIENRVPVARSANSGITCVIDRTGQVLGSIPKAATNDAPADCLFQGLFVPDAGMQLSFYTRYGDWFAWLCVILSALLIITAFCRKAKIQPCAFRA